MTDIEVALTDLGEIATRELAKEHRPYGLEENTKVAKMGGNVAKVARDDLERKLGKTVISSKNSLNYQYLKSNKLNKDKLIKEKNIADPFYSTTNTKRLEKAIADLDNGKGLQHELIEVEDEK